VAAVVRGIQTRAGHIGYRDQLDRARRFLERIRRGYEGIEDMDDVEFQDMVWSFFQHCWHVKDWLHHDPWHRPPKKLQPSPWRTNRTP